MEPGPMNVPSPPRHLWVVGLLGVLWNSIGAFDYVMTQTRNASYMSQFNAEQLEFFYGFPPWVVTLWALAVWGGVAGTILLLFRKGLAVPVLAGSLICMVATSIHNYILSNGLEVSGAAGVVFSGLIFLVALGLWTYARAMRRRGVLA